MLAGIVGWLNFLREWVKDIQDMEGDRVAHHHTMAMRLTASFKIAWASPQGACWPWDWCWLG